MKCPKCKSHTIVLDSRTMTNGNSRRRRQCESCNYRYSTIETETTGPYSDKDDNDRRIRSVIYKAKSLENRQDIEGETLVRYKDKCFIGTKLLSLSGNVSPKKGILELIPVDPKSLVIITN